MHPERFLDSLIELSSLSLSVLFEARQTPGLRKPDVLGKPSHKIVYPELTEAIQEVNLKTSRFSEYFNHHDVAIAMRLMSKTIKLARQVSELYDDEGKPYNSELETRAELFQAIQKWRSADTAASVG